MMRGNYYHCCRFARKFPWIWKELAAFCVCVPIFLQLHWQKVNSFKWDLSAANLLLDYKDRYARPFVRHIDIALLAMMQLPEKPGNSSTSSWMLRYFHAVDRSPPQTQTIDARRTILFHWRFSTTRLTDKKYASRVWLRKGLKSTAWKWHYLFLLYLGMSFNDWDHVHKLPSATWVSKSSTL